MQSKQRSLNQESPTSTSGSSSRYVASDLFKNCESLGMIEEYKFAMIELIEKEADEAILFLHTKGE